MCRGGGDKIKDGWVVGLIWSVACAATAVKNGAVDSTFFAQNLFFADAHFAGRYWDSSLALSIFLSISYTPA